jgi:hypothetical protein
VRDYSSLRLHIIMRKQIGRAVNASEFRKSLTGSGVIPVLWLFIFAGHGGKLGSMCNLYSITTNQAAIIASASSIAT